MKIVSAATRRPVTVVVFFVALVIFGVISFRELPVDLLPDLSFPTLTIRTEYPGVAPADVETFVTTPIEDAVGIVSGLVDISSVSRAGLSDVIMEFAWGTDMDFAAIDVREQLAQLGLPAAAEDPILLRFDPALDPIMRISVGSAVPGDVTAADQAGPAAARRAVDQATPGEPRRRGRGDRGRRRRGGDPGQRRPEPRGAARDPAVADRQPAAARERGRHRRQHRRRRGGVRGARARALRRPRRDRTHRGGRGGRRAGAAAGPGRRAQRLPGAVHHHPHQPPAERGDSDPQGGRRQHGRRGAGGAGALARGRAGAGGGGRRGVAGGVRPVALHRAVDPRRDPGRGARRRAGNRRALPVRAPVAQHAGGGAGDSHIGDRELLSHVRGRRVAQHHVARRTGAWHRHAGGQFHRGAGEHRASPGGRRRSRHRGPYRRRRGGQRRGCRDPDHPVRVHPGGVRQRPSPGSCSWTRRSPSRSRCWSAWRWR